MATRATRIIMNGVTGRMGTNQHLMRSLIAIKEQGGVTLGNGDAILPEPLLVGRNPGKLEELAIRAGGCAWTTDLDTALSDPTNEIYFDAQLTSLRPESVEKAIDAGKHVYCEKPTADTFAGAMKL